MKYDVLRERIDGMLVSDVYSTLEMQLELKQPNGATVHRLRSAVCVLRGYKEMFMRTRETFAQLRREDPEMYVARTEQIERYMQEFHIHV